MASRPTGTPSQSEPSPAAAAQVQSCCLVWRERLVVYRQLVVWTWRALNLTNNTFAYFLAIMAATNVIIMALSSANLSGLMLLGAVMLLLAGLHMAAVFFSQSTHRMKLLTSWGQSEEADYQTVCLEVAKVNCLLRNTIELCLAARDKEPKKFYVYGLLLCVMVSYIGSWIPGALLAHCSVTLLLLVPLAVRHGLLNQLANQNWALVWESTVVLSRNVCQSLLSTLSQLLASIRVLLATNRTTSNTTHQPQSTTTTTTTTK